MHVACSSNGNGCCHAPKTPTTTDRLGAACAEPAASPENGGGRDAKGRFAAGNAGGPGNPFARRTAELRREFLAEASGEDLRAICRALLERAKGGDVAAAKLALGYLVGKPGQAVDPDTLDEQEWHFWRRYTAPSDWVELIQTLPLDIVLSLVRSVWPVLAREKCAQAEPLFTTPGPVPPQSECEAASAKPRTRRRAGKGRRPEGEERSPGGANLTAALPAEESRPQGAGPLGGPDPAGAACEDDLPDGAQEASASECSVVDPKAGRLAYERGETTDGGAGLGAQANEEIEEERAEPAPDGQIGTPTHAERHGEQPHRQTVGEALPAARGSVAGEHDGNGAGGVTRCPSADGANGAGAAVNKRHNRPGQRAPRADAGQGPDVSDGGGA
jgi:hypothetical protein